MNNFKKLSDDPLLPLPSDQSILDEFLNGFLADLAAPANEPQHADEMDYFFDWNRYYSTTDPSTKRAPKAESSSSGDDYWEPEDTAPATATVSSTIWDNVPLTGNNNNSNSNNNAAAWSDELCCFDFIDLKSLFCSVPASVANTDASSNNSNGNNSKDSTVVLSFQR